MLRTVLALVAVLAVAACGPNSFAVAETVSPMCADTPESASNRARLTFLDAEYQTPVLARGTDNDHSWCVFGSTLSTAQYWAAVHVGDHPSTTWDLAGFPTLRLFTDGWAGFVTGEDGRPWTLEQAGAAARRLAASVA